MKNVLIVLLGNRDLQIHRLHIGKFPHNYDDLWMKNNDSPDFFTIQTRHTNETFLSISEKIEQELEGVFKDTITFPMVEQYVSLLPKEGVEKIIFTTSEQTPLDKQDCFHIGNIATKLFSEKGFKTEFRPFACNPTDFGELVNFYLTLFNEYKGYHIVFGNSGGTPDMRAATYFAGIFRNIEFITINAREKQSNKNNFRHQERLILQHTVKEMLQVFDYEGINQLPISNQNIKHLAQYAQARIALNFEKAKEVAARLPQTNDFNKLLLTQVDRKMQIKDLERETYFSAKIKYHQGSFSDYLWRLFTIHDNMFIPTTENLLGGQVEFNKKDDHSKWNNLIDAQPDLVIHLESKVINSRPLNFREPNKFAYKAIVDYFLPKGNPNRPVFIDEINACLENLGNLRNAVAHNYKGIGKEDIVNNLPKKYATTFNDTLSQFVGEKWSEFGIYQAINDEILKRFDEPDVFISISSH
jgi:CRISPR-associated protein (Cas_Csm6)